MELIDPSEHSRFLSFLERHSLPQHDFVLVEVDTTDPKSDEIFGLQGWITIRRLSAGTSREYLIGDESDWLEHFSKDVHAGTFGAFTPGHPVTS
ncbi:transcriptional regulator [Cupriavidus sp. 2TAF22]|uniref:transcriptional regulator n=1 Tax=unclassified Cupriavidus TaxID=2640874 RepID=UPI003F8F742C